MPFIRLADITMFYRVINNGSEMNSIDANQHTLLVLHGGPGIVDHQIEFDAWSKFSSDLQVVFIDQRGSGQTENGNPKLWNLSQCGQDIKDFCDSTGIIKPLIAGVSWGGYVAMSYATQYPEHPAALILCNTEAKVDLSAKMLAYRKAFEAISDSLPGKALMYNVLGNTKEEIMVKIGNIACDYDKNPSPQNFELLVKFCVPLFSRNPFAFPPPFRVNMSIRERFIGSESLLMDYSDQLQKVPCPVLQLAGERDPTHPAICAEKTARSFSKAQFFLIPDAGAPVYQDQEQIFLSLVKEFINTEVLSVTNYKSLMQI